MSSQQLDAVGADLHPALGTQPARQRHLTTERLALIGAAGRAVGRQAHPIELDRDVCHHERHRLAVGDRLAERRTLVDIGNHVIEHRLTGSNRQRAPSEARELDAVLEDLRISLAEQRGARNPDLVEAQRSGRSSADAHRGLRLNGDPRGL